MTLESSEFAWNCIPLSVFPVINKAVSSAKNLGRDCKQDGRSLTLIRNNNGPKIEPWGTPYSITNSEELKLAMETNCFCFSK